jgi:hypothetical protein
MVEHGQLLFFLDHFSLLIKSATHPPTIVSLVAQPQFGKD